VNSHPFEAKASEDFESSAMKALGSESSDSSGDLLRAFQTADSALIHAADCRSTYSSWTCCGGPVLKPRVPTPRIVPEFDVPNNVSAGMLSGRVLRAVDPLVLQGGKAGLCHCAARPAGRRPRPLSQPLTRPHSRPELTRPACRSPDSPPSHWHSSPQPPDCASAAPPPKPQTTPVPQHLPGHPMSLPALQQPSTPRRPGTAGLRTGNAAAFRPAAPGLQARVAEGAVRANGPGPPPAGITKRAGISYLTRTADIT
jgi:hypothetical protein